MAACELCQARKPRSALTALVLGVLGGVEVVKQAQQGRPGPRPAFLQLAQGRHLAHGGASALAHPRNDVLPAWDGRAVPALPSAAARLQHASGGARTPPDARPAWPGHFTRKKEETRAHLVRASQVSTLRPRTTQRSVGNPRTPCPCTKPLLTSAEPSTCARRTSGRAPASSAAAAANSGSSACARSASHPVSGMVRATLHELQAGTAGRWVGQGGAAPC